MNKKQDGGLDVMEECHRLVVTRRECPECGAKPGEPCKNCTPGCIHLERFVKQWTSGSYIDWCKLYDREPTREDISAVRQEWERLRGKNAPG